MKICGPAGLGRDNRKEIFYAEREKEDYLRDLSDSVRGPLLHERGYVSRDPMYTFNSEGFRCKSFVADPESIILIGCSFAFGYGEWEEHTLSGQLSDKTNRYVWNLGSPGGSADESFRILRHYIDILQPKHVVFLETYKQRREFKAEDEFGIFRFSKIKGNFEGPAHISLQQITVDEESSELNFEKNVLAMRQLCADKNTQFHSINHFKTMEEYHSIVTSPEQVADCGFWARDFSHPGRTVWDMVSDKLAENIN